MTGEGGLRSAVVVGTGLIGTSIALALRECGVRVGLADRDPASARLAADIGAGTVVGQDFTGLSGPADLAVLAVPPAAAGPARAAAQAAGAARWYTTWPASRARCWRVPGNWAATTPRSCPGTRCPGGSAPARPPRGPTCSSAAPG